MTIFIGNRTSSTSRQLFCFILSLGIETSLLVQGMIIWSQIMQSMQIMQIMQCMQIIQIMQCMQIIQIMQDTQIRQIMLMIQIMQILQIV